MTIHVNIGEAKSRLSQLIAAAKRGERVVIDRDGQPEVELVPVSPDRAAAERRERLRAFCGSVPGPVDDSIWDEPEFTDEELDRMERPDG